MPFYALYRAATVIGGVPVYADSVPSISIMVYSWYNFVYTVHVSNGVSYIRDMRSTQLDSSIVT
jgi:hypothetical protein